MQNLSTLLKRLEILRQTIALQDQDDISYQVEKFEKVFVGENFGADTEKLQNLATLLTAKKYSEALQVINEVLEKLQGMTIWEDPEIAVLQAEIKVLQVAINQLQDEKADIEKQIQEFSRLHTVYLGEIILQILEIKRKIAAQEAKENPKNEEKQQKYEDTHKQYEKYKQGYEQQKKKNIADLSEVLKDELKQLYRKASKLCHPDIVATENKEKATQLFQELQEAYQNNDVKKVKEIADYLETGKPFSANSSTISEKTKLKAELNRLENIKEQLTNTLQDLKNSDSYQKIIVITDFHTHFEEQKQKLAKYLKELQEQKT